MDFVVGDGTGNDFIRKGVAGLAQDLYISIASIVTITMIKLSLIGFYLE